MADATDVIRVCETYDRMDAQQRDVLDALLDDASDTFVSERDGDAFQEFALRCRRAGLHDAADEVTDGLRSAQGPGAGR